MNISWKFTPLLLLFHVTVTYYICMWVFEDLELHKYFETNNFPPQSIDEVKKLSELMKGYAQTRYLTLVTFHCAGFYFLQTWWIPGTFMFNLLSGSLFGAFQAWLFWVVMNTLGGYTCFWISKHFGKEIVQNKHIKTKADNLSEIISQHKDDLFFYLTFLRIFPGSPNWLMNITFPHLGIKDHYVIFSIFFGLMPWNFIVCEAGSVLSTIQSKADVLKPETYVHLILIAFAFLLPPLIKKLFWKNIAADLEKIKQE